MWALGVWLKGQISGLIEAARANLTTTINTRATPANVTAAQTALTTAINTRATPANVTAAQTAINNHVTNHVNSRTVAGGQPQAVRSVQRGSRNFGASGALTANIDIAAVNVSKSIALISGGPGMIGTTLVSFGTPTIELVNSTRVTLRTENTSGNRRADWQVIEYF